MTRREEMLREMGLMPLWKLRGDRATAVSEPRNAVAQPAVTSATPDVAVQTDARRDAILRMGWAELEETVAGCRACALHTTRTKTVFGVGDGNANWMFIGEGPGADEDALGEPFVGQAGRLLDNMLAALDLKRQVNVYIANVVKCRPPANRNPQPEEAQACEPFLQRQIDLIKPRLIVALGRVAALNLLGREASIASLRGQVLDYKGTPLIVTYHPAYLLRSLNDKAKAWEDLCFALKTMEGSAAA
jgi:uracil-DNA glycosylase family 4